MVESAENLFRRMRWKLFHHQNPGFADRKETFGFKTQNKAPFSPLLKNFEEKTLKMLSDIEYKKSGNDLQAKMKNDLKVIADTDKVLTKADKTSNIYKMEPG